MLSALSNIYGTAHQVAAGRSQANTRTETAVAALAALSPAQPLPSVSDPFDDDDDGFSFLYRPNGLPPGGDTSTESTRTADTGSAHSSRLGMESTQLSSLLSSLMAPAAATSTAVQASADAPLQPVQETLIAKLYRQF